MKLVSTLPERVGFLHAVPILDLFTLLLIALLIGPGLLNQSGIQVEAPVSRFQISRSADAKVITVTEGDPVVVWLGRERVTEDELISKLKEMNVESGPSQVAYIRCDRRISAGDERRITESVLAAGFRVYLLGGSEGGR